MTPPRSIGIDIRMPAKPEPASRSAAAIASKQHELRERVRGLIHSGALRPGERVNEQAMAAEFGVGRNVVREALRSLEQIGLVRIVPNRGAEVRRVALEDALELYDIRASLAREAGRLTALRVTPEVAGELEVLQAQMSDALARRDGRQYQSLNAEFHQRLLKASKNARLIELNQAVENELALYIGKGVFSLAQMQASDVEHRHIVEAVGASNAEAAASAFEAHVRHGRQRMLDTVATLARVAG